MPEIQKIVRFGRTVKIKSELVKQVPRIMIREPVLYNTPPEFSCRTTLCIVHRYAVDDIQGRAGRLAGCTPQ